MASNPVTSIPEERLLRARNFKEFCKYPWGNLAFDYLRKEVESFTYTKPAQESPSNTLVLESNEDDTVNDDATEIKSSRESHSNTSFLEATETETQNHEPVDGVELPLPHESDDMMDVVATPIIDPQEIPRGETMSKSDDKIALLKRISEPDTNGGVLDRINKRSNLKLSVLRVSVSYCFQGLAAYQLSSLRIGVLRQHPFPANASCSSSFKILSSPCLRVEELVEVIGTFAEVPVLPRFLCISRGRTTFF
ncbi:hypothetical protein F2Q69_00052943 [Brassica cretica]|uniref:Uncharacterized protein n=1 Tax=Brassica cretica TaxID=69181 RepID=A0A8S9N3Z6_BRACR|nr:hypothetical protein F2Q69_00052943 [Brassica cretica]